MNTPRVHPLEVRGSRDQRAGRLAVLGAREGVLEGVVQVVARDLHIHVDAVAGLARHSLVIKFYVILIILFTPIKITLKILWYLDFNILF